MMHFKEVIETVTTKEILSEMEMIPKYFWCSRSVFAVEFNKNIYNRIEEKHNWDEIIFTEVKFEQNIIRSKRFSFNKEHPLTVREINREQWIKELMYSYTTNKGHDERTKEQFDTDFNNVINCLKHIRD